MSGPEQDHPCGTGPESRWRHLTMGWRDRDYARWTPEERQSFLGPGAVRAHRIRPARSILARPRTGTVVVVVCALFALGQLPAGHPLVPALHVNLAGTHIPFLSQPSPGPNNTIGAPGTASTGSFLDVQGTAQSGPVTVEGSYDGTTWQILASAIVDNGTWVASIPITQRGTLHLRALRPDGSQEVGTVSVQ